MKVGEAMYSHGPTNVKLHNKHFLKKILKEAQEPITKSRLSKESGLSVVTINKLIPEMLASGEVLEMDEPVITGGRRAAVYELNKNYQMCLVILYIEKEKNLIVELAVVNLFGETLVEESFVDQLTTWENIEFVIDSYKERFPTIDIISIGIPGVEVKGILEIMDLDAMRGMDLRKKIEERFNIPVMIENDINAAILGYKNTKASEEANIVSGLYFPENYPPGAALVINNEIFHGSHGLSGEVKHLPSYDNTEFPLTNEEDVMQLLNESIQTILSMYDPDEVIVYGNSKLISSLIEDTVSKEMKNKFPYGTDFIIKYADTFQEDYYQGLIMLGIMELDKFDFDLKNY